MRNTSQTIIKVPDQMLDYILALLQERPYKESAMVIQTLTGQANDPSIQNMVENAVKEATKDLPAS